MRSRQTSKMDGSNLVAQQHQQHTQHLGGYSNHNTNHPMHDYEHQTNPQQQQTRDEHNEKQCEQYDRLTSNTSIETTQSLTCDISLGTKNDFAFNNERQRTEFNTANDAHHQQTFLLGHHDEHQDDNLRLQADACDTSQEMNNGDDDDDAFVAFCADSSSVLGNDLNGRYHINKLYQPLTNNSSDANHHQHTNIDLAAEQNQMEQDDEYLLYQELRFIESSAQEMSGDSGRTELSKILDDDDCDGVDRIDSLDCMNLTTMIESFDDFGASSLIENCNGERDPLMSEACSQESLGQLKPDSTGCGNDYLPSSRINSINEFGHEISSNNLELDSQSINKPHHMNTNHQHQQQNIFAQQSIGNCEDTTNTTDHHYDYSNESGACNQTFKQSEREQASHRDITSEIDSCIQILSEQPPPASAAAPASEESKKSKRGSRTTKRKQVDETEKTATDKVEGARKLKKKRSTPASNKRSALTSSTPNKTLDNDEGKREQRERAERIKELTSSLLNDEDESMVSDNNSMRSESGKRDPIVSHYRRRTANARERIRMREINQAFEKLKKVVPAELIRQAIQESEEASDHGSSRRKSSPSSKSSDQQSDSMKLTKITTLRLAVSYIAKLTDILKQSPENPPAVLIPTYRESPSPSKKSSKVAHRTAEDKGGKTNRRSRATIRKGSKILDKKHDKEAIPKAPTSNPTQISAVPEQSKDYQQLQAKGEQAIRSQQPVLIAPGPMTNDFAQQHQPQTHQLQTAFISIPGPQRQQYITAPLNAQQLLVPQQMVGSSERQLVTPVAVAILGIPNNTHGMSTNGAQGLQFIGMQKPQQHVTLQQPQQQPVYNFQLAQSQQQQTRQPQQVTLTLDDLNGLSVLRLTNPQNQSMPIQIKTTNNQFIQNQQQTQIFTAPNGLNYAFRPLATTQQSTNTNIISTSANSMTAPTNLQQATFQICNTNTTNLIPQNNGNNIGNNNIIQTIDNFSNPSNSGQQHQSFRVNGQTLCNMSRPNQILAPTATISTGTNSDLQTTNFSISSAANHNGSQTEQNSSSNYESQQPIDNNIQQQRAIFVPSSNMVTISASSSSSNRSYQTQAIPIMSQCANNDVVNREQQDQHNQVANVVYINPIRSTNPQQRQVCVITNTIAQQSQVQDSNSCSSTNQDSVQKGGTEQTVRASQANAAPLQSQGPSPNKMDYVTHFGVQATRALDSNTSNETNINQLVASLATSIQPSTQTRATTTTSKTSTPNDSQKVQQHQQTQPQQQSARTYRFHNYDGNMINNHLYGSNSGDKQGANQHNKRGQAMKQLQDNMSKITEQAAPNHRSRQNSLSSICSTTSCSSSSPNSTSSTSGSPANHSFVVSMIASSSPRSDNSSGSNSSPILIEEVRAS